MIDSFLLERPRVNMQNVQDFLFSPVKITVGKYNT